MVARKRLSVTFLSTLHVAMYCTCVQQHTACKIRGSYSRSAKYSRLLGYYVVSIGNARRNNPEETTSHLHHDGSLKSRNGFCTYVILVYIPLSKLRLINVYYIPMYEQISSVNLY